MSEAEITRFTFLGKQFTNIAINEIGEYRIPSHLLDKPILSSVLEVVDVLFDRMDGFVRLQPQNSIVTTELLTEDVRLEVYPKVSFDALNLLLHLSSSPSETLPLVHLPVGFEKGSGFFDLFVSRFLDSLQDVVRNGWCPRIASRDRLSESPFGLIDQAKSLEHLFTRLELAFFQQVDEQDFDGEANRVIKTCLVFLTRSGHRLSARNFLGARGLLSEMPVCKVYESTREAIAACDRLLTTRSMESGRDYYYAALASGKPILEAISRVQGGSVMEEHIPIRIAMPITFENALRNVTATRLARRFVVSKGKDKSLYESANPVVFNPVLEPDIVISQLGNPRKVAAVLDVKYKGRPSSSDHHQLAAYMFGYRAKIGGFLTLAEPGKAGLVSAAKMTSGEQIVEFAIDTTNLLGSVRDYLEWLSSKLASSD
jgi:5-methylcytosine-specific restriction endonuclease McrBC regulatory subunit McrC